MAGERTRDINKIAITITSEIGKRTLTSLFDWDSGEGPELVKLTDPDLSKEVMAIKMGNKSRTPTIKVRVGSQDEKFLDRLAEDSIMFDMNVVDNSSKLHAKQHTGKECYITKAPADPFREGTEKEYSIVCVEFKTKHL